MTSAAPGAASAASASRCVSRAWLRRQRSPMLRLCGRRLQALAGAIERTQCCDVELCLTSAASCICDSEDSAAVHVCRVARSPWRHLQRGFACVNHQRGFLMIRVGDRHGANSSAASAVHAPRHALSQLASVHAPRYALLQLPSARKTDETARGRVKNGRGRDVRGATGQ